MENIRADELMRTIAVILAVFAAVITVDRVIDIVKKWHAPTSDLARKLDMDKRRLDGHDKAISDIRDSQQTMLTGVLALLDHELHNGNADQMQAARDEIMKFLQGHIGG